MDRIEVKGLRIQAKHGCHPEERLTAGPFEVDIVAWGSYEDAIASDDIAQAIDYVELMEIARSVMAVPKNLIETVARDMANLILARLGMTHKVEVTIKKLRPPVSEEVQYVSAYTCVERPAN